MEKDLKLGLVSALNGTSSVNFSAEDVNEAAINAIMKEVGLTSESSGREIRAKEDAAFALIEEAVDEILPAKLQNLLGEYAEVRQFPRDAEVIFNIDKIGKGRAKLTIARGARGGIYRAARLDSKHFGLATHVETVAVYVTLEELILGTMSLAELFNNILEGFEEIVYKEVFNALATGSPVAGYERINGGLASTTTTVSGLGAALDAVLPYVKQYGTPTIFGSPFALAKLANEADAYHPELEDSRDRRQFGMIRLYKGVRVVELPNYLVDATNSEWFYDTKYVFVMPSGIKPVKIALKGDMTIIRNTQAVGSEKWEAHKLIGVGLAMANNFAVITVEEDDSSL